MVEYNGKKGSILKANLIKTSAPSATTSSKNSSKEKNTTSSDNSSKKNTKTKVYYKNKYPLIMRKEGKITGNKIITIPANSTIEYIKKDSEVSNRVIVIYKNKKGSVLNCGLVKITPKNKNTTYKEEYKYYAKTKSKCSLYNSNGKEAIKIEKNELIKVISLPTKTVTKAKVEYYGKTYYITKNDFNKKVEKVDNAIFVSINKQKETLIRDGLLVIDTPVVTGNLKNNTATKKGSYKITQKKVGTKDKPISLMGNSKVIYWMRVYGNVGIHDADNWRSSYGGTIYKTRGSHGCINTPLKAMKVIYENSYVKMPVYIQ